MYDAESLLEEQTGAEQHLPGVERVAVSLELRSGKGVFAVLVGEDILRIELLAGTPVGVQEVGYVVDIQTHLDGGRLVGYVEGEILGNLYIEAVLPSNFLSMG